MSSVEERVARMKFDNAQFLTGVSSTLKAIDALNKGLKLDGATKGLENLSAAGQKVNLKGVSDGVDSIASKFKNLSIVAITALGTITNQAVLAGQRLTSSFSIKPVLDGFHEYETNLNSIQTILANTSKEGTKLGDVTKVLDDLNHYADQTIYNFSEMARNVGTFTAAGVKLGDSALAIKGIANLAALSGSNSEQASAAMYQLSQALSAGKVSLEDWNSVVNAGMGGKVFQDALIQTARVHGVAVDQMIKDEGSFRLSLQKGWLSSSILSETLQQFTGNLTKAQLKAIGYNDEQIAGIQKMAKTASDAATKVKTFTQLINTLQEAAGSGWARTWQLIFGNFDEAKSLFTNVNDVLGGFVNATSDARNKVLSDWKQLGGRTVVIDAISKAFQLLISVVKPIGQAFRDIFPPTTGKQLYELTVQIRDFIASLSFGSEAANNLRRTFAGVFAILSIGIEIGKQVLKTLLSLFGIVFEGSGSFLEITANIGDFLVALKQALVDGKGLEFFFGGLGKIIAAPLRLLKQFASFIGSLFDGFDGSDAASKVTGLTAKLAPLGKMGELIAAAWAKVISVLDKVVGIAAIVGNKISEVFGNLGTNLSSLLEGMNFKDVLAGINTGLFAGLVLFIKQLIGGNGVGGILNNIGESFEKLTDALGAMQNTLRAATLLQIAAAVGILAISMNTLSKIDAAGLTRASVAITVMFTQLISALLIFEKFSGFTGFAKMPFVATSMILLGVAVNVLASAMKKLAELDWNGLAKGLVGVQSLLAGLVATSILIKNPAGMISTGVALVILAGAVKLLVSAVTDLAGLSWEELAKGLVGVGALLGALGLFTKFATVEAGGVLAGAGLLLMAAGIKILASAVQDLSGMSWEEIAKGVVALAGALALLTTALILIPPTAPLGAAALLIAALSLGMVGDSLEQLGALSWGAIGKGLTALLGAITIISLAVSLIPPNAPLGAAALLIAATSLGMVGDSLAQLGAMDWGSIGKSLAALAGAMLIIGVAVTAMTGALTGAAALLVVSASLAVLAPVLLAFGNMSWSEIGKGLLVLAAALTILGVAGALLTPVVPTLLGLGAAVVLLGAGMALAGVGVLAFAAGLTALSVAGAAGTAAIVAMVAGLSGVIPVVMENIAKGVIAFAKVIAVSGPAMTAAMTAVISSLIDAIVKLYPKIGNAFYGMILVLLTILNKYVPSLIDRGANLVTAILNGLAQKTPMMVTAAVNLLVAFINGVSNNLGRVIDSGVKLVISFVNGVADAIRNNQGAMNAAGQNLASAIIEGMTSGLFGGVSSVINAAASVAASALDAAKSVLGIHSPSKEFIKIGQFVVAGFRQGIDGDKSKIDDAFVSLRNGLSNASKAAAEDVAQLTAKLNKLLSARKKDQAAIKATTAALAQARAERAKTSSALAFVKKYYTDDQIALGKLADQYDVLTDKIKTADDALKDAIKTRDDYNKSIRDQFDKLPETTGQTTLAAYVQSLRTQIDDTKKFATAIQQLRTLGLNDALYKELLSKGAAALPFINDVLAAGQNGVLELNKLGADLDSVAGNLGDTASKNLYQAAVDAAAGFLKGLQDQQAAIEAQMDKIADAMVKAIKSKLGIKSPSRVFNTLGVYSAQGLANGLKQGAVHVEAAAKDISDTAVESLRKNLAAATKMTLDGIETQPTIRPVLDLTQFNKDASTMGSKLPTWAGDVAAYRKARYISGSFKAVQNQNPDSTASEVKAAVSYTQNNYSPKALSSADIYRQTKNQLSVTKGDVVGVNQS